MNAIFIVGNKRSGSTHLMRLLNLHDKVFISNESDVVWILYCFHNQKEILPYPHDSPGGMIEALKTAKHSLNKSVTPKENFINFQLEIMRKGFLKNKPVEKTNLQYIGDQKPYQNIDPELLPFILETFPNAKFLHILRHPFEVVSSSLSFDNHTGGYIWKDMGPDEIMAKWEQHENWVRKGMDNYALDLLQVNYKDLISNPKGKMAEVFSFLNLDYDHELLQKCDRITLKNFKRIKQYNLTQSQKELMKSYSMKTSFTFYDSVIKPVLLNNTYRVIRKGKSLISKF